MSKRTYQQTLSKYTGKNDPNLVWKQTPNYLHCSINSPAQTNTKVKLACFDLDFTLIKPKSGAKFPRNGSDWMFLMPNVVNKLQDLHDYVIVILSNQSGLLEPSNTKRKTEFQEKIQQISLHLSMPVHLIAACCQDIYRKPRTGMWQYLESLYDIDRENSFFVGDAAGRIDNWKPGIKRDFSDTDRKFAINCGITFHTPEVFFNDESHAEYKLSGIDPLTLDQGTHSVSKKLNQECVMFIGFPASGKSTFYQKYFSEYSLVSQDKQGTLQKSLKMLKNYLDNNQSVVLDNLNANKASRKKYLDEISVPVRCFYFKTDLETSKHLNMFRHLTGGRKVPSVAYNTFLKNFEEPSLDEGFIEIIPIEFKLDLDHIYNHKELFLQRLI